jgi:hypothetical protein
MTETLLQKSLPKVSYRSWVVYGTGDNDISNIQNEFDKLFSRHYSFYPECEWDRYGFRPPEKHQIMGAWRHCDLKVFIFLLNNPSVTIIEPSVQLLLYVAGVNEEILMIEDEINGLKDKLALKKEKEVQGDLVANRLERINKTKPFKGLMVVFTVVTAIINCFSLYLRKLPPPELYNQAMAQLYQAFIGLIHLGSLLLLIIAILLYTIILVIYGFLLIKRL